MTDEQVAQVQDQMGRAFYADVVRLEDENKRLRDVLTRFREFVIRYATQWDISDGPCNHHNPIWQEVAQALEPQPQAPGGADGGPFA
jgi:hypothetical protein